MSWIMNKLNIVEAAQKMGKNNLHIVPGAELLWKINFIIFQVYFAGIEINNCVAVDFSII